MRLSYMPPGHINTPEIAVKAMKFLLSEFAKSLGKDPVTPAKLQEFIDSIKLHNGQLCFDAPDDWMSQEFSSKLRLVR